VTGTEAAQGRKMIPLGFLYKRVAPAPAELQAVGVRDVYSLSGHISEDFADYIDFWRHNGYWLFDTPTTIPVLARDHGFSLHGLRPFYYEAYELEFLDETQEWLPFEPAKDIPTRVQQPAQPMLEGFDVVSFSCGNAPECSPLSCNLLATKIPTNAHCLLPTLEDAIQALESGLFDNSEPGPFRVIAVYSVPSEFR
jgi:hypothetical protein